MASTSELRSFSVAGAPSLRVHNRAGSLQIVGGPDGHITVRITKTSHGGSFGWSTEHDLDRVQVRTEQDGDFLRIDVDHPGGIARGISVHLALTVPARTTVAAHLDAGDLRLQGVSGSVHAVAAAGSLETQDVTLADGSNLEVNAGRLSFAGAVTPGASVALTLNTGNCVIVLPKATAALLDASVNVGEIHVSGFAGHLNSARALVRQQVSGPLAQGASGTLRIRVNVGGITLRGE